MIECYNRNNDNNIELLNYRIYSGSVSQIKSELYPILRKLSYKNNFIEFVLALKEGNYEINSMIILIYYKLLFDLKTITNKCISNENLIKILDIGLKFNENIIKLNWGSKFGVQSLGLQVGVGFTGPGLGCGV